MGMFQYTYDSEYGDVKLNQEKGSGDAHFLFLFYDYLWQENEIHNSKDKSIPVENGSFKRSFNPPDHLDISPCSCLGKESHIVNYIFLLEKDSLTILQCKDINQTP